MSGRTSRAGARRAPRRAGCCRRRRRRPGSAPRSSSCGRRSRRSSLLDPLPGLRYERSVEPARRGAGSPKSARPAATATSVAVSVSPPKTSARASARSRRSSVRPSHRRRPTTRAAAEPEREHVGHPEVRPHAADLDRDDASRGKPCWRMPTSEVVPPMSTTAQSRSPERKRRAAHRVRRAGRERRDRVALGVVDGHQRPVVLAQVDGRVDRRARRDAAWKAATIWVSELAEASVHDRRVLALEQADPADLVGEADRQRPAARPRRSAAASCSRSALTGENTDEIATERDALRRDVRCRPAELVAVERCDLGARRTRARRGRGRRGRRAPHGAGRASRPSAAAPPSPAGRAGSTPSARVASPRRPRS